MRLCWNKEDISDYVGSFRGSTEGAAYVDDCVSDSEIVRRELFPIVIYSNWEESRDGPLDTYTLYGVPLSTIPGAEKLSW